MFGFKDWRFHVAKMELGLRTDGIIMTRMNKTTAWVEQQIEELGEEEFDKWFDIVVSTAFTKATEDEYRKNHADTNAVVKRRRRAKILARQEKEENRDELLALAGEEEYDAENLEAQFADLGASQLKDDEILLKVKRQWQRLKIFGLACKIPVRQIMWPNQPAGTNIQDWKAEFVKLFADVRLMGCMEEGRANLKSKATVEVRSHALGEVLDAIPEDVCVEEEVIEAYKKKCHDTSNMDISRSKAHRDAAAAKEAAAAKDVAAANGDEPAAVKRRKTKGAATENADGTVKLKR